METLLYALFVISLAGFITGLVLLHKMLMNKKGE
jgi:hypothetical protein